MLTELEANTLMNEFVRLREKVATNPEDTQSATFFKRQERLCLDKLSYIVYMHTSYYKAFSNYEDLCQEGFMALSRALFSYNPKKKSNPFWWVHKYVGTTISRKSSLHSAIRYPLTVAKKTPPHRETVIPTLIEKVECPDLKAETNEISQLIHQSMQLLDPQQQTILNLVYGFNGEKPLSINKVCQQLNLSRTIVKKSLRSALAILNDTIKL